MGFPLLTLLFLQVPLDGFCLRWVPLETGYLSHKSFIGPVGFAFCKFGHFTLTPFFFPLERKKGTKDFSLVPLKKYFVFL